MPIGLAAAGPRQCDLDAKALLGRRGSSVFITPCRAALRAVEDYERACELNRKACGKAFSKQAFGILRKIREIDRFMTPALQDHLREAHPEVIFAVHNAAPMQHRKSTAEGKAERL
jgi:predicted RNase H-like nuclease